MTFKLAHVCEFMGVYVLMGVYVFLSKLQSEKLYLWSQWKATHLWHLGKARVWCVPRPLPHTAAGPSCPPSAPLWEWSHPCTKTHSILKHCSEVRRSLRLVKQVEKRMSQQSFFVFKYNVPSVPCGWAKKSIKTIFCINVWKNNRLRKNRKGKKSKREEGLLIRSQTINLITGYCQVCEVKLPWSA